MLHLYLFREGQYGTQFYRHGTNSIAEIEDCKILCRCNFSDPLRVVPTIATAGFGFNENESTSPSVDDTTANRTAGNDTVTSYGDITATGKPRSAIRNTVRCTVRRDSNIVSLLTVILSCMTSLGVITL